MLKKKTVMKAPETDLVPLYRSVRVPRHVLGCALVALVGTACGSDQAGAPSATVGGSAPTATVGASVPGTAGSTVSAGGSLPGTAASDASESAIVVEPDGDGFGGAQWDSIEFVFAVLNIADPKDEYKALEPRPQLKQVKECVEAAGFEYDLTNEFDGDPRFSMDPESYARTWGFGTTAQLMGTYPGLRPEDLAADDKSDDMSDSEFESYSAVQAECLDAVGIDPGDSREFDAANEFKAIVEADPRVQAATKAWSECMAQSGYQYPDPETAKYSFLEVPDESREPSADDLQAQFELEKLVAIANLSCQPPYLETYRAVATERFAEFQSALVAPRAESDAVG